MQSTTILHLIDLPPQSVVPAHPQAIHLLLSPPPCRLSAPRLPSTRCSSSPRNGVFLSSKQQRRSCSTTNIDRLRTATARDWQHHTADIPPPLRRASRAQQQRHPINYHNRRHANRSRAPTRRRGLRFAAFEPVRAGPRYRLRESHHPGPGERRQGGREGQAAVPGG